MNTRKKPTYDLANDPTPHPAYYLVARRRIARFFACMPASTGAWVQFSDLIAWVYQPFDQGGHRAFFPQVFDKSLKDMCAEHKLALSKEGGYVRLSEEGDLQDRLLRTTNRLRALGIEGQSEHGARISLSVDDVERLISRGRNLIA